jgi:hypothetical protein
LLRRFLAHIDLSVVLFGLCAVAAFWFAIQLCWSAVGKRWYSVAWRLVVALALFGMGFVMIFFTAFGA